MVGAVGEVVRMVVGFKEAGLADGEIDAIIVE
jgi:hypothetical protein